MNNTNNLPPIRPTKPITINMVPQNHYRPMLVYVYQEIYLKMKDALAEEDMNWDNFIQRSCIEFLNQRQRDREELNKYIAFSEMQLFEEPSEEIVKADFYADESSSSSSIDILEIFKEGK